MANKHAKAKNPRIRAVISLVAIVVVVAVCAYLGLFGFGKDFLVPIDRFPAFRTAVTEGKPFDEFLLSPNADAAPAMHRARLRLAPGSACQAGFVSLQMAPRCAKQRRGDASAVRALHARLK